MDARDGMAEGREMRRFRALRVLTALWLCLAASTAHGWGETGHTLITRKACEAMPEPLRALFLAHAATIASHSMDPDLWRREDRSEGPRHFLDVDYEGFGPFPFTGLPREWRAAAEKFGEETLRKYGVLPWRVDEYVGVVAEAWRSGDDGALTAALGALSHYVADAHMPLHAVVNYDGQLTGQKGVHNRWEDGLVDRYAEELDAAVLADAGRVRALESPLDEAFEILLDSYAHHFALLNADRRSARGIEGDPAKSPLYFERLWTLSGGLCAQRLSEAATAVASYWLTAWEHAGRPTRAAAQSPRPARRARDLGIRIGRLPIGTLNAITDVEGVKVGHVTVLRDEAGKTVACTGVTAVVPRDDVWHRKVPAAAFAFNGNGEATGTHWINEAGWLEVPILLTGTLNVPRVANGVVSWMSKVNPAMGRGDDVVLPVVAECDDSGLNDSRGRYVTEQDAIHAIESAASGRVEEGAVGAGTGMTSYGFKGGIGTASRRAMEPGYTVGALVLANGGRRPELRIDGVPVGEIITDLLPEHRQYSEGSFIIVVATDAPLDSRQLGRLARRASFGLARTGTAGRHGSGDFVIAFSTATVVPHSPDALTYTQEVVADSHLNELFTATVEATEEAIVNALVAARTTEGRDGRTVHAIPHDRLRAAMQEHARLYTSREENR
jgi:D-aminopeptidase